MAIDTHTLVTPGSGDEYKSQARPAYQPPPNVYGQLLQTAVSVGISSYKQLQEEKKVGAMAQLESDMILARGEFNEKILQTKDESVKNKLISGLNSRMTTMVNSYDVDSATKMRMLGVVKKQTANWTVDGNAQMTAVTAHRKSVQQELLVSNGVKSGNQEEIDMIVEREDFINSFPTPEEAQIAIANIRSATTVVNVENQLKALRKKGVAPEASALMIEEATKSLAQEPTLTDKHKEYLMGQTLRAVKDANTVYVNKSQEMFSEDAQRLDSLIANGEFNEMAQFNFFEGLKDNNFSTADQKRYLYIKSKAGTLGVDNPFISPDEATLNKTIIRFKENGATARQKSQMMMAIQLRPNEQERMRLTESLKSVGISPRDNVYNTKNNINEMIFTGEYKGKNIFTDVNAFNELDREILKLPIGQPEQEKMRQKAREGRRSYESTIKDNLYNSKVKPLISAVKAPLSYYNSKLKELPEDDIKSREGYIEKINKITDRVYEIENAYHKLTDAQKQNESFLGLIGLAPAQTTNDATVIGIQDWFKNGGSKNSVKLPVGYVGLYGGYLRKEKETK